MRGLSCPDIIVSFLALAVALYFGIATAFNDESNFALFLWRAFAPTTALCVGGYFIIRLTIAKLTKKKLSLGQHALCSLMLIASVLPIARCWRDFVTPPSSNPSASYNLTVLDMNLLGHRDITPMVLPEIRRRLPDIVLLQEVTAEIAATIYDNLKAMYPCQIFDPRPGSYGMATLAKHPCQKLDFVSQGYWVGRPQIIKVSLPDGRSILGVNIHGVHPHALIDSKGDEGLGGKLNNTVFAREQSISEVLSYVRSFSNTPVVMAGDLNATMRNRVYSLIRDAGYEDSWLTTQTLADMIFRGGTWPFPEHGIPRFAAWILRIDFIFSQRLVPLSTEVLPASLGSDHRGLVARFR